MLRRRDEPAPSPRTTADHEASNFIGDSYQIDSLQDHLRPAIDRLARGITPMCIKHLHQDGTAETLGADITRLSGASQLGNGRPRDKHRSRGKLYA